MTWAPLGNLDGFQFFAVFDFWLINVHLTWQNINYPVISQMWNYCVLWKHKLLTSWCLIQALIQATCIILCNLYKMQGMCQAGTLSEIIQSLYDLIIAQQAHVRDRKASAEKQIQKFTCIFGKVLEGMRKISHID